MTEVTIHEQHYKQNGTWISVNEDIQDIGQDLVSNRMRQKTISKSDGVKIWTPEQSRPDEYVIFGAWEYKQGGNWKTLSLNAPGRNKNVVTWGQTDYRLIREQHTRLSKETIVLNRQIPYSQFRVPVTLHGFNLDGWKLVSQSTKEVVAQLIPMTAADATLKPIPVSNTMSGGYWEVSFTIPGNAVYPVVIDPTTILQPGATGIDTYLAWDSFFTAWQNTNFGTSTMMNAQRIVGTTQMYPLFSFDCTSIPTDATLSSAVLTLITATTGGANAFTIHNVLAANASWGELTATWNVRDGSNNWAGSAGCSAAATDYGAVAIGSATNSASSGVAVPVTLTTATVQGWVTNPATNYGMTLRTVSTSAMYWGSSDGAAATRPKLTLIYSLPYVPHQRSRIIMFR
jgi:hypothetical protein